MSTPYRYEFTSLTTMVQQIASAYLPHGYLFYVMGRVPEGKEPEDVDRKLIEKYGIALSRRSRSYRKSRGEANVQYLRYDRQFLLMATHGEHRFWVEEGDQIRDARKQPIHLGPYAISVKRGHDGRTHSHVRIARKPFVELKALFGELAVHRSEERMREEFARLDFEAFAPVRRQLYELLRLVNRRRKEAGLGLLPFDALQFRKTCARRYTPQTPELPLW